jgi:hypothetical protein
MAAQLGAMAAAAPPPGEPPFPVDETAFETACFPLSYSGNPGVNGVSYRGAQTHANYGTAFLLIISASVLTVFYRGANGAAPKESNPWSDGEQRALEVRKPVHPL